MNSATQAVLACFLFATTLTPLHAAERFVNKQGDPANDGLTRDTAFLTIQRGLDALEPGDTLTIGPGEYHEAVARDDLGSMDAETLIRAEIPGTVLLRGDVPAPGFRKVDGYRFVYVADFPHQALAVNEADTLRPMQAVPNVPELEFNPGHCHYDADEGKLYISPTDLQPPDSHRYTVSILKGRGGMFLHRPRRVVIDGLAATGFHSDEPLPRLPNGSSPSDQNPWGFFLARARECVIRNSAAYLNAGGITVRSGSDIEEAGKNIIEGCAAYGNAPRHGIIMFAPNQDEMRGCVAFYNASKGIEFYIGGGEQSRMLGNLAWGSRVFTDVQLKAGGPHLAERVVGVGGWGQESRSDIVRNSLIGRIRDIPEQYRDNIGPDELAAIDFQKEFADPAHHDYRLQATSRFRGAATDGGDLGPFPYKANIRYVRPDGDDSADGLSVRNAWKTLTRAVGALDAGDTLYIEGGVYEADLILAVRATPDEPLSIRSRGEEPVVVNGDLRIEQSANVDFKRINFTGRIAVENSESVAFENCRFNGPDSGLRCESVAGLRATHCEFAGIDGASIDTQNSRGIFVRGNVYDNQSGPALRVDAEDSVIYSDYNAYSDESAAWAVNGASWGLDRLQHRHEKYSRVLIPRFARRDGMLLLENRSAVAGFGPLGMWAGVHVPESEYAKSDIENFRLVGPVVHSVSDTTANIEWWTSIPTDRHVLRWGETPETPNRETVEAHRFGTFSLTGLKPDTTYYFAMESIAPLGDENAEANLVGADARTVAFKTAAAPTEPATYYVAPDGDDANSGKDRANSWRTLTHAASQLAPGDTLLLAGGTYSESVRLRSTGEQGRPITIKAAPGEKVLFNGDDRALQYAFMLSNKAHVNLDGFYFVRFGRGGALPWGDRSGWNGVIVLDRSNNIQITRCFHDGRGPDYSPGILMAMYSKNVLLKNSVVAESMGGGISFAGCPDLRIENNVFLRNFIQNISEGMNEPDQKFYVTKNIFTDNLPKKVHGAFFAIGKIESMVEKNNWYYLRIPDEERRMFQFYGTEAYERAARGYRIRAEFDNAAIQELTRMSLAEYQRRFAPDSGSRTGDPDFAGTRNVPRATDDGENVYRVDRLIGKRDLDFPDVFATNPKVAEAGIGLIPEDFEDFHFNK